MLNEAIIHVANIINNLASITFIRNLPLADDFKKDLKL
jgi:hypothetical protein